ncbi:MAG: alkaline phosphatase D family protein [Chitinophagaceae bacterium]
MRPLLYPLFFFFSLNIVAQSPVVSGPMLGPVELRDAKVWVELSTAVKKAAIQVNKKVDNTQRTIHYKGELGNEFNPIQFIVGGLEPNTVYEYTILANGKATSAKGEFQTKPLWQWRGPAPDFSFLTGSCSYFNEPKYDRPGTPYGKDVSIFEAMAKEKSPFMVWLGDAWYTREVDYYSEWGLWYRASKDRATPALQPFLKSTSHLGIWDDHDYGPNDMGGSYHLKEASRKVFSSYFPNPSVGENSQGIYTQFGWGDVELFMVDDRWWRSADRLADSINGKPNPEKVMLGKQQMTWLKNALLSSYATFKIIAVGSQVLNPVSPFDKWGDFPAEFQEFMQFLQQNPIDGIVFLTGDRHHSEIIKIERPGSYPLYDITVSPLTSGTHEFGKEEKDNPYRVIGVDQLQNYGRISFTGPRGARKLTVEFLGTNGEKIKDWSVSETELKVKRK